ncbi:hydrolase, NUDIX family domain protein [Burkholderia pseudomallei MSHR4032]|nr:hydrolase, NUDIX family domain protein [Burkholderia pseudomallei MSHR7334]KGU91551.1 hydrolase, NUDIX family domain protein [Burkholderia pseudomallei MSHR4032]KGV16671.1 hydrolase, NUDIX family domain protein [Burkholderia pseudomallei MSHR4503]
MRRAPLPAYRSLSAIPFACRFRLPLLTPGPLPLAPSPFYSLPFTFTLRPRPVSRFQPSAGGPPFGQRRAPARARRPGATTAHAGHDARRPSAFGALTNPRKTCPPPNAARSRVQTWRNLPCDAAQPRLPAIDRAKHGHATSARGDDCVSHAIAPMHVYAHVDTQSRRKLTRKEAQCMNRSHSMPAWPGGGPRRQHARPARQAPRRRHAAATQRAPAEGKPLAADSAP